jgi:branched-chain amino acid transport system substrate-binding protein
VGFGSSQEVVDLATQVFGPKHILVVASENRSTLLASIPRPPGDPRLVFRTTLGENVYSVPVTLLVPGVIEPKLVRAGVIGARDAMRVALIRSDSTADLSVADQVFAGLRFNGKSALENGDKFRQFVVADLEHPGESLAAVVQFRPHVIVFSETAEMAVPIVEPIENAWRKDVTYRPYWVSESSLVGEDFFRFIGSSAERRRRFFGVAPASTTMANARLTMRYNEVFHANLPPAESPAASYDAFYVLAYAAIASGGRTGPELAGAIGKLIPPGAPIDVGPTQILPAVDALRSAGRFDLGGIMTRLDFDLETGDAKGDLVVTCVGIDETGRAHDGVDSGVRYDSKTGTLVGSLSCP